MRGGGPCIDCGAGWSRKVPSLGGVTLAQGGEESGGVDMVDTQRTTYCTRQ